MSIAHFSKDQALWKDVLRDETEKRMQVLSAVRLVDDRGEMNSWGDTVILPGKDIRIKPLFPNAEITDEGVAISAEHGCYYHFYVRDYSNLSAMRECMSNTAERLAVDMDNYLLQTILESKDIPYSLFVSESSSVDDLVDYLLSDFNLGEHVSILFPKNYAEMLSDKKRESLSKVCRLILTEDLKTDVLLLLDDAFAFCWNVSKIEAYTPERGFVDGVKGLALCGAKVIDPWRIFRIRVEGVVS